MYRAYLGVLLRSRPMFFMPFAICFGSTRFHRYRRSSNVQKSRRVNASHGRRWCCREEILHSLLMPLLLDTFSSEGATFREIQNSLLLHNILSWTLAYVAPYVIQWFPELLPTMEVHSNRCCICDAMRVTHLLFTVHTFAITRFHPSFSEKTFTSRASNWSIPPPSIHPQTVSNWFNVPANICYTHHCGTQPCSFFRCTQRLLFDVPFMKHESNL